MQLIPAVDVLDGDAVRLSRGDYASVTRYSSDPVSVAKGFVSEGAGLLHVVDLDAARGRQRSFGIVRDLSSAGIPFQIGGGIRTADVAREAIDLGAERVVLGSVVTSDPEALREIVREVGSGAVVAAVDVRDGLARGSGWLDAGTPLQDVLSLLRDIGVVRALVTGIETDGMMEGPALSLFEDVRRSAPDLALIASGGVGNLEDIEVLSSSEVDFEGVIVGRAIYEGRFTLPEAIRATR